MNSSLFFSVWQRHAERIAWDEGSWQLSFAALRTEVEDVRRLWRAEGLSEGAVIALHGLDSYQSWICILAAAFESCSIAPLPSRASELEPYLAQLPFTHWIGEKKSLRLKQLSAPSSTQNGERRGASNERGEVSAVDSVAVLAESDGSRTLDPERPFLFIFSSGSSGQPKAVQLGLGSLIASAHTTLNFYEAKPGESWLLSLELSHIGGFQIALRAWLGGLRCISGFAPHEVGRVLPLLKPSFVSLVPTQLKRLIDENNPGLTAPRVMLLGGAGCPDALRLAVAARSLPVSITYGSSETASQVAAFKPGIYPTRPDEVGTLLPGWDACIRSSCLALRGPALAQGTWAAGRFTPLTGQDTWYLSSDRAALEGNALRIQGRADGVFQVAGENVSPAEITGALAELASSGDWIVVPEADPTYGHRPVLIYRDSKAPPPLLAIETLLRAKLPGIKRPTRILWHRSDQSDKPSRAHYSELLRQPDTLESTW